MPSGPARTVAPRETRAVNGAPLPRVWRWGAVGWLAVWTPVYAQSYGWRNFLQLCDVAVVVPKGKPPESDGAE